MSKRAILYLDRNSFNFYFEGSSNILKLDLPLDVVGDQEIINREKLNSLIGEFIKTNKIPRCNLIIIFSKNILFIKNLTKTNEKELITEADNYIETVPFEKATGKTFKIEKNYIVVVLNYDLVEFIKIVFEQAGFIVYCALPDFIFEKFDKSAGMTGLDSKLIKLILKKIDALKIYNLLVSQKNTVDNTQTKQESEENENLEKEQKNKKLFYLVIVFLFLLGILGFVIKKSSNKPAKTLLNKQNINPTIKPTIIINSKNNAATSAAITAKTSTSESKLSKNIQKDEINIQIVYNSKSLKEAKMLQEQLTEEDFSNIKISESSNNPSKTLLIVSQKVPSEIAETIFKEIKKIFPEAAIQENNQIESEAGFEAVIILSKSE